MLTYDQIQILRRLLHHKACISVAGGCDAFPAHPNGDRRKRPAFWVLAEDLQALKASGAIDMDTTGYVVVPSMKRRLLKGKDGTASGQHYDLQDKAFFVEGGVKRQARVNRRLSALDRLALRTDANGYPILETSFIEAGKRLAQDYEKSGHGVTSTQFYDGAAVDGGQKTDRIENQFAHRLDTQSRLQDARDAMGSGLDVAVIAVCCLDQSLDAVERAEKWASGTGLTLLKMGLSRLSEHYGTVVGVRPKTPHQKKNCA
jgi:hypothetical protein